MTLEIAVYVTEGFEIFARKISSLRKCCIESGSGVSLGEYKAVAIRLLRVARINIHLLKVEIRENVGDGERSAGMSGACAEYRLKRTQLDICGYPFEFLDSCLFHIGIVLLVVRILDTMLLAIVINNNHINFTTFLVKCQ